jgi:hypothetical protein
LHVGLEPAAHLVDVGYSLAYGFSHRRSTYVWEEDMDRHQMSKSRRMLNTGGLAACAVAVSIAFATPVFAACGGEGEKECTIWEAFPSCRDGRIAYGGNCYTKNACGKENQRACIIVERFPSCDPNLVESSGKCIHPNCGRKDQRPCVVTERIPSCDKELIEYGDKCYAAKECGAQNGRPCTVVERVPSCDGDLKEYAGKCVSMNWKAVNLTIVNDCDKKIEAISLYDQRDLVAGKHAGNIFASHLWQTSLKAGQQVKADLSLPQNYPDGSPWLYKIRATGKCVIGGEAGVSEKVDVKVSGEQIWTIPCDKGGKGKDFWYENLKHGASVRICGEFSKATPGNEE